MTGGMDMGMERKRLAPRARAALYALALAALVAACAGAACASAAFAPAADGEREAARAAGREADALEEKEDGGLEIVDGEENLAALSEAERMGFEAAVASKLSESGSGGRARVSIPRPAQASEEGTAVWLEEEGTGRFYTAQLDGGAWTVRPLAAAVEGVNAADGTADPDGAPEPDGARTSNEGSRLSTDTTGYVSVADGPGLARILPAGAAASLAQVLPEYMASKGYEVGDPARCAVDPGSVGSEGATASFSILVIDDAVNRILVDCSYDAETNSFAFSVA